MKYTGVYFYGIFTLRAGKWSLYTNKHIKKKEKVKSTMNRAIQYNTVSINILTLKILFSYLQTSRTNVTV